MFGDRDDIRKNLLKRQFEMKKEILSILNDRDYKYLYKDLVFLTSLSEKDFDFKANGINVLEQIKAQKGDTFKDQVGNFLQNRKILTAVENGENKDILFLKSMENENFDFKDERGNNPLMIAAANGNSSIVNILIHKYPDLLTQKNNDGDTALMLAKKNKHKDCVEKLIMAEEGLQNKSVTRPGY